MKNKEIINKCNILLEAYKKGELGYMKMPEDENPGFGIYEKEKQLVYFTLPMGLNYQRNSYKLWEGVLKSYSDIRTNNILILNIQQMLVLMNLEIYSGNIKLPYKLINILRNIGKMEKNIRLNRNISNGYAFTFMVLE